MISAQVIVDDSLVNKGAKVNAGGAIPPVAPRGPKTAWPDPPDRKAFHGPAGEFVQAIEPHSEADPMALLIQVLAGFGSVIRRGPYFPVEADRHYTNEFAVLVGASSKARKGTSESRVRSLLSEVDSEWASTRISSGLSSGEGLIWAVRDSITKHEPIRDRGQIKGYQDVEADPGVSDKRLLVFESEFSSVLRQLEREGNTLSAVIRSAFDTGNLRSMTKNSPAVATNAHISILGHVVDEELRRYLSATEQGNGFANRFLWLCVKRSKFLPEDEDRRVSQKALLPVIKKFNAAARFAKTVGEMKRDETAREYWRAIYRELSSGKPGLLGAVTSRAEAHVTRLSCIFALLDQSPVVRGEHLEAATALWEFCENSCRYIFGDATGNPDADLILKTLRSSPAGVTRTEINNLFGRNKPASAIGRALDSLLSLGLVRFDRRETEGRSAVVWSAV